MGLQIEKEEFTSAEYTRFNERLAEQLKLLKCLSDKPDFGGDIYSFGAELELYIIDDNLNVLPINKQLLAEIGDPRITLELNKFNLEMNLSPVAASGQPFSSIEQEMLELLGSANEVAEQQNAKLLPVGILPTLRESDLDITSLTSLPRYRALMNSLQEIRGKPFQININGPEPLVFKQNDISMEGANTSFQFHIRVPLSEFSRFWNAMQLVTPLVLALAANSPMLFGHRLWHETRIALFKQSVDVRDFEELQYRKPARVNYGYGWMREGPWEAFAENVSLFEPLLPICGIQDDEGAFHEGKLPQLEELRLHQGTIWSWNRAIYDPACGGHFRIESRALPAGPSLVDMVANAALLTGLAMALKDEIDDLIVGLPFYLAESNFYRAAQKGLNAEILWPDENSNRPKVKPIIEIIESLLTAAEKGLRTLNVDELEIKRMMQNIQTRLVKRSSGALWQLETFENYKQDDEHSALEKMVKDYCRNSFANQSISEWT